MLESRTVSRQAVAEGLSYEKARLVARCPDDQVEAAISRRFDGPG